MQQKAVGKLYLPWVPPGSTVLVSGLNQGSPMGHIHHITGSLGSADAPPSPPPCRLQPGSVHELIHVCYSVCIVTTHIGQIPCTVNECRPLWHIPTSFSTRRCCFEHPTSGSQFGATKAYAVW